MDGNQAVDSEDLGMWHTTNLDDLDEAVFYKGGSILPILEHEGCMAIMNCINNDIHLEMYLDSDFKAEGSMYLDDYETFDHLNKDDYALLKFHFDGTTFWTENTTGNERGDQVKISSISVYGFTTQPSTVKIGEKEVKDIIYDTDYNKLVLKNLNLVSHS